MATGITSPRSPRHRPWPLPASLTRSEAPPATARTCCRAGTSLPQAAPSVDTPAARARTHCCAGTSLPPWSALRLDYGLSTANSVC